MSEIFAKLYIANVSALENEELFSKAYSVVSKERQEKVDRCHFLSDKCMSLGAGLLLEHAKLENEGNYSLSHSGGYSICLASSSICGCDIEKLRDNVDYKKLANRYFNLEVDSLDEFITLWTRYESNFKAGKLEECYYRTLDIISGFKITTCLSKDIDLSIENITISSIIK